MTRLTMLDTTLVLLILFCLLSLCLHGLSFEAEELTFTLSEGEWVMDGLFHFANYSEVGVQDIIAFPIPEDSLHLHPEVIAVEAVDSLTVCSLHYQSVGGLSFRLSLPPKHFGTIRIAYKQKLLGNNAVYIITTANAWKQPLRYASYRLIADKGMELTSLPFAKGEMGENEYFWEFIDFVPKAEFEVGFR